MVRKDSRGDGLHAHVLPTSDGSIFVLELEARGPAVADVVLIPPYGKSSHELVMIAHQLSLNGFNVIRFDPRNHVGRSTGSILDFTLQGVEADAQRVLDSRPHSRRPVLLAALSLSAPIAWKVATRRPEVAAVVSLVGVVDVTYTVELLIPERSLDHFRVPGLSEEATSTIFGYQVRGAQFTRDIDRCGYRTLEQTLSVLGQLKVPAHMIVAEQDEYVRLADVERARTAVPAGSELLMMGGMTHEVGRSLRAARMATSARTSYCRKAVGLSVEATSAPFTDVIKFSGAETEFLGRFDAAGVERGAA